MSHIIQSSVYIHTYFTKLTTYVNQYARISLYNRLTQHNVLKFITHQCTAHTIYMQLIQYALHNLEIPSLYTVKRQFNISH